MTTQALQKVGPGVITLGAQYGYTPEYLQLIKDTFAKDATDNELQMFVDVCHHTKLNPMNKEIYFWKQQGKVIIHTGIDGHRLCAERTGRYAPGPPVKRTHDEQGNHTASTAYVRKKVGSDWFVIEETAYMNEWKKDSSPFWKNANTASHQLDITAERHALKKAFPSSFAGMSMSGPNGEIASETAAAEPETPEQTARREELTDCLLRVGKLFCTNEQFEVLRTTVAASALPVLEERHENAMVKLREYVLAEIGKTLQGEAYSKFIVEAFPKSIEATGCVELFNVVDRLKTVPAEAAATTASAPATAAPADAEAVSQEESDRVDLQNEIMELISVRAEGDLEKIDEILDGRALGNMSKAQLEKYLAMLKTPVPF